MSELDQLFSKMRQVPEGDDLKASNEQVEHIKTHTFGISYFVPDPYDSMNRDND